MNGGWDLPEVAKAQRALVEKQLAAPERVGPFQAFLHAMRHIALTHGAFLDIGCGVGHYGVLLAREYPQLRYTGYDASRAMIAEARSLYPQGRFRVRSFECANLWAYDIVMAAQVMEYQDEPWVALEFLLGHAGWTILHRLRLTDGPSRWLENEPTYCGNRANNYLWNLDDVVRFVWSHDCRLESSQIWGVQATLVVRRDGAQWA